MPTKFGRPPESLASNPASRRSGWHPRDAAGRRPAPSWRIPHADVRRGLQALAGNVSFPWIRKAVARVDDVTQLVRRNIQKTIALGALIVALRAE